MRLTELQTCFEFVDRHIGPSDEENQKMLDDLGFKNREDLVASSAPKNIQLKSPLDLPESISEVEFLAKAKAVAQQNKVFKSYIGMGYNPTHMPTVIQRNIFENPAWYTAYTPYQAEISQGRMEALLNFQTMVTEMTCMEIANASLLDEGTAVAEAVAMSKNIQRRNKSNKFLSLVIFFRNHLKC